MSLGSLESAPLMATDPSCGAVIDARDPWNLAIGVRATLAITIDLDMLTNHSEQLLIILFFLDVNLVFAKEIF